MRLSIRYLAVMAYIQSILVHFQLTDINYDYDSAKETGVIKDRSTAARVPATRSEFPRYKGEAAGLVLRWQVAPERNYLGWQPEQRLKLSMLSIY